MWLTVILWLIPSSLPSFLICTCCISSLWQSFFFSVPGYMILYLILHVILLITPVLKVIQLFLYDILMLLCIDCCSQLCVISTFYQGTVILCAKVTNKNITYNWPQDLSLRIATFSQQCCSLFSCLPVSQFLTYFAALLLCFIVA